MGDFPRLESVPVLGVLSLLAGQWEQCLACGKPAPIGCLEFAGLENDRQPQKRGMENAGLQK